MAKTIFNFLHESLRFLTKVILILILAACSTVRLIQEPRAAGSDPYGPANDEGEWGTVAYPISLVPSIEDERRQAAQKFIYDYCGGEYEARTYGTYGSNMINFRCLKPKS
ncbi:MAG: hypothetical protein OEY96_10865 [Gammaproteobacteria bacterium]|nr:hypothetical protein [Gammaproteobacteria bacterium]